MTRVRLSPSSVGTVDARAERRARLAAIALMCAAPICFACLDACAKVLAREGVDPLLATFMRYAVNFAVVAVALDPVRRPAVLRTDRLGLQILRSLLLFGSTACNFLALRTLQLAETVSIQFAAPLAVAVLAGPLLGEWSSRRRLAAIAMGFLGVLVIVRPGFDSVQPGLVYCLGNMTCYALYVIVTRKLAAHDSSATTIFYTGLAGIGLMAPLLPWIWADPGTPLAWIMLVSVGLAGTLGHWLLVLAHARAPANVLAPFIYTQILWSATLGFLVFGDRPSGWTLAGAGIIVGSGLALLAQDAARRPRLNGDGDDGDDGGRDASACACGRPGGPDRCRARR